VRPLTLAAALLMLAACSPEPRFLERSVRVGDRDYKYRVWLPPHYTKVKRWPVILYLHGSGERGDDNLKQLAIGLPISLERHPDRYKCVVVIPQCLDGHEWYGEMEQQALAALDKSIAEFHGDRRRVTVTGISMGGAGAWYLGRHRSRWAAIVPVCGEVARARTDPFPIDPPPDVARIVGAQDPYATLAELIGTIPVWAFHGADDKVIPPTESRAMVAALRARNGNVRYTEYPQVGHNAWDFAYEEMALPKWMMVQKKK